MLKIKLPFIINSVGDNMLPPHTTSLLNPDDPDMNGEFMFSNVIYIQYIYVYIFSKMMHKMLHHFKE